MFENAQWPPLPSVLSHTHLRVGDGNRGNDVPLKVFHVQLPGTHYLKHNLAILVVEMANFERDCWC